MNIFANKILSNSLWMILEKLISILGLIFVNSYMAKYVGPENFGKLVFTTSIFLFVQTFSLFGTQNILFKRLSMKSDSGLKLAFASQIMRRVLYLVASIVALSYLYMSADYIVFVFAVCNCIATYFIVSDVYTIYNNSQLNSFVNVISNVVGLSLALILRYVLVKFEFNINYMAIPVIVIAMVPYFIKKIYFLKKENKIIVSNSFKYNKYLIFTGGSLVLSTLSITLYTQISNILLAKYTSYSDLGVYNIAVTIGGAWAFVNLSLITSFFSRIYSKNNSEIEKKYLTILHYIIISVSVFVYVFLYIYGDFIIRNLYGEQYLLSLNIVPYAVVATMLSALGTISYRYIIKYSGYRYLSIKMLVVSLLSMPLSYYFIKYYGILGAMKCLILLELISLTVANYFFRDGLIMKMHFNLLKAIFGVVK
ncbi:oligosaccharide flippase family protein [Acinetobacter sp. YH01009]|uniref:oligosaccharide flippase family protein n=1 Tax=Acinetobacter sp. YH01009 TaxID=2601025 RepID=UPI0015D3FC6C|nr:oligosaccharide flippase family protein [Acinetobacter sp. YH01009]